MMTFSKVRLRDAMVSRRTFDLRARRVEWRVAARGAEEAPRVGRRSCFGEIFAGRRKLLDTSSLTESPDCKWSLDAGLLPA